MSNDVGTPSTTLTVASAGAADVSISSDRTTSVATGCDTATVTISSLPA